MELEQGRRADDDRDPANPTGLDEERPEAQQEPVQWGQVRRPFSGTIGDEELVPDRQGFGDDGTGTARRHQFGQGRDQVQEKNEGYLHAHSTWTIVW